MSPVKSVLLAALVLLSAALPVGAAGFAAGGRLTPAPRKAVLVVVHATAYHGGVLRSASSIAGLHRGDSLARAVKLWGKPDWTKLYGSSRAAAWQSTPKYRVSLWGWVDGKRGHNGVLMHEIVYYAPFQTVHGDKLGTPLAVFRKHWPAAKIVRVGPPSPPGVHIPADEYDAELTDGQGSIIFAFQPSSDKRLFAVGLADRIGTTTDTEPLSRTNFFER
jgi:hypothetical protein